MSSAAMTMPAAPLTTADGEGPGHMTLGHWRRDLAPGVCQPAAACSEPVPKGDFGISNLLQFFSSISSRLRERSGSRKVQPASSTQAQSPASLPLPSAEVSGRPFNRPAATLIAPRFDQSLNCRKGDCVAPALPTMYDFPIHWRTE